MQRNEVFVLFKSAYMEECVWALRIIAGQALDKRNNWKVSLDLDHFFYADDTLKRFNKLSEREMYFFIFLYCFASFLFISVLSLFYVILPVLSLSFLLLVIAHIDVLSLNISSSALSFPLTLDETSVSLARLSSVYSVFIVFLSFLPLLDCTFHR